MSSLIAFFSRKDENYMNGTLRELKIGNTSRVASVIQALTGGELFEIEMATPYSKSYNECVTQAQEHQRQDARPALVRCPNRLVGYDTLYLGYPNYWGTMPMAVFTFLEQFDWSGKTIKPFCTHEGSGLGSSSSDIKRLCPKATVAAGLAIHGSRVEKATAEIEHWI